MEGSTPRYDDVLADLRRGYDGRASARDDAAVDEWKVTERLAFLEPLRSEGRHTLLEVGAGPRPHGSYFGDEGLEVVCTDLSPENVRLCRAKGLEAYAMDFLHLDFGARTFDAAFAMNCLVHVPRADLDAVLRAIRETIVPGGLFYLGQYGGVDVEGIAENDTYEPKRFFSRLTDERLLAASRLCSRWSISTGCRSSPWRDGISNSKR